MINWRMFNDSGKGAYTRMTQMGCSAIDLVLAKHEYFENFTSFTIYDFVEFSKHIPVTFSLKAFIRQTTNIVKIHVINEM